MPNIKEGFKKDFESKLNVPSSFDTKQLEINSKVKPVKKNHTGLIISLSAGIPTFLLVALIGGIALANVKTDTSIKKKMFTKYEVAIAESNSFYALNNVDLPSTDVKNYSLNEKQIEAYMNFVQKTKNALTVDGDFTYAPSTLYPVLNEISETTETPSLQSTLLSLFGLEKNERTLFYKTFYQNNFNETEEGRTKLYNFFFTNRVVSDEYLSFLQDNYCSAYKTDFSDDCQDKIVNAINDAVNEKNFIDKRFLEVNGNTCAIFLSTLNFEQNWYGQYTINEIKKETFRLANGSTKDVEYIEHCLFSKGLLETENYYRVSDEYKNGYSVNYYLPKENISSKDLIKLIDFSKDYKEKGDSSLIDLYVPMFKNEQTIDFSSMCDNLGLRSLYEEGNITKEFGKSDYLAVLKQKNLVDFNEKGSSVKSVTMGGYSSKSAGGGMEVKLNRPFVYSINDYNGLPLFIGGVDNPTK